MDLSQEESMNLIVVDLTECCKKHQEELQKYSILIGRSHRHINEIIKIKIFLKNLSMFVVNKEKYRRKQKFKKRNRHFLASSWIFLSDFNENANKLLIKKQVQCRCNILLMDSKRRRHQQALQDTQLSIMTGKAIQIISQSSIRSSLIGFCDRFQWFLRQIITMEGLMVSYQRVDHITNLQPERQLRSEYDSQIGLEREVVAAAESMDVHQAWPDQPSLQFKNLSARYKPSLPRVIKDLNFVVEKHSKIGIVGRTGAGKSSIIQAIFRIIESQLGSMYNIGTYDALQMGIHSLRQHISVIPQTPFLFKGSVKLNLDPFSTVSEEQLWKVLEESGLYKHVQEHPKKLETDISNTSQSFSTGQKQLLCIARALLRRNKFLVLDEATSNVDMETDTFIQAIIKEKFKNTTMITIAHRLNTIAGYDKIIVMEEGRIVEMGAPYELILKRGSFFEMVEHTGQTAALITSKAKNSLQVKHKPN